MLLRFGRVVALAFALAALPAASGARAQTGEPSTRDIVVAYNTGLRFSLAPGLFIPTDGGKVGFSLAGDVRYGFELGPTIVAPGVRLAGFFPAGARALTALGTLRVTVPAGPVAPFLVGGVGPGWVSDPSHAGLAYLAGGGLMLHIGQSFGIGVEASYFGITDSWFRSVAIGPSILLSF